MLGRSSSFASSRLHRAGTGVLLALAVVVGAVVPSSLALSAGPAGAATCPNNSSPCPPTNVQFGVPGQENIPGERVCGIVGNYGPVTSNTVHSNLDDPYRLNQPTHEGNYTNSESFRFTPATDLTSGQQITIKLPHPAEPYPGSGSILPPAQVPVSSYSGGEQTTSTVNLYGVVSATDAWVRVRLTDGGGNPLVNHLVRLDGYDPFNPQPLANAPGPNASGNVVGDVGPLFPASGAYLGSKFTDSSGNAYFDATGISNRLVVFGATDKSNNVGIAKTLTYTYGSPAVPSDATCLNGSIVAPGGSDTNGSTYILFDRFNIGHLLPPSAVQVAYASGVETVTLTVPPSSRPNQNEFTYGTGTVKVEVLDAVSPPGGGAGCSTQTSDTQSCFLNSDFAISTSVDSVPAYPSTVPYFNCCNSSGFYNFTLGVAPWQSTLQSSDLNPQVTLDSGPTVTATLHDDFNNPVSQKQVAVYQDPNYPPSHANVADSIPPATQNPPPYPISTNDGSAAYSVIDSCAETVHVVGQDVQSGDQNQYPFGLTDASRNPAQIVFRAGPSVAPDDPTLIRHLADCSVPATISSITADSANQPADGVSAATVTVTSGDQFGNVDACHRIVLSPKSTSSHATITPLAPDHPCTTTGAGYSGTDGKAKFSVSDATDEQVVLGVSDTTNSSVWPSDEATNPTDVAVLHFLGVDRTVSTVVASRTTGVPANGQPAATVTVTLRDSAGQPVRNKFVTLAATPADPTTTITPHTATPPGTPAGQVPTDASGQAVFDVADNSVSLPHQVTYQATDASDGLKTAGGSQCAPTGTFGACVLPAVATISFSAGGASISANPSSVVGDGFGTSAVNFTLKDTGGTAVPGATVVLTPNAASTATVVGSPTNTDANGAASFTVSDTQAEPVTFTATATYGPTTATLCPSTTFSGTTCTVTIPVNVSFIAAPDHFTLTAAPATVPGDGASVSKVTVTAFDAANHSIPGVTLRLVPGAHSGTIAGIDPVVTDFNGQAAFNVTDTSFEVSPVTFTAQYQSAGWHNCVTAAACSSVQVQFIKTEAQASTVVAAPTSAPADGHTPVTVTVTLNSGTQPIAGHSVALIVGSTTTNVSPSNIGATTNGSGQVSFTLTDPQPEVLTIYGRDLTTGVIIDMTATVTFLPTEAQNSTIGAVPASLLAGGGRTATVTVQLLDYLNAPIAGHSVRLTTGSATTNVSPPVLTDASGHAQFLVSDSAVETLHIGAVDTTANVTLANTVTVAFVGGEANQSTVTINPITTPASGPSATLTVFLRDAAGHPIAGHTVTVGGTTATMTVTPLLTHGVTDANGEVQFAVSDTAVETDILTATDLASGLLDQTATIKFTATEANQSSISASPSTLPAAVIGAPISPTTTVTVTLRDRGGAPIVGDVVSLSASTPNASIKQPAVTTNAAGQAAFTVGDPAVEATVLSALDRTTGVTLVQTVTVNFVANEANQSTATASPLNQKVKKLITITVTLRTATGSPIAAHKVTLNTHSTNTTVTPLTKTSLTNSSGQIQFTVTDSITETLSIDVTDVTAVPAVQLYQPVVITFFRP
jgi:hypothetical protein